MKIKLSQAIVVEGKYDKIRLSGFIDAVIIETNGFSIFNDKNKLKMIRNIAKKDGIIILTDSDAAGFKIRSFLVSYLKNLNVFNAYIPDIYGKEKRKILFSKEGKLGVEGIENNIILNSLKRSGAFNANTSEKQNKISKYLLYQLGFYGKDNSANLRRDFQHYLNLPKRLSANALIQVLNSLFTPEDFNEQVTEFLKNRR